MPENFNTVEDLVPVVTGHISLAGNSIKEILGTAAKDIAAFFDGKPFRITKIESYPGSFFHENGKPQTSVAKWNVDIEFEEIRGRAA